MWKRFIRAAFGADFAEEGDEAVAIKPAEGPWVFGVVGEEVLDLEETKLRWVKYDL